MQWLAEESLLLPIIYYYYFIINNNKIHQEWRRHHHITRGGWRLSWREWRRNSDCSRSTAIIGFKKMISKFTITLLFATAAIVAAAPTIDNLSNDFASYKTWCDHHQKTASEKRFGVWQKNYQIAEAHNAKYRAGLSSYYLSVRTRNADLTNKGDGWHMS